MAWGIEDGDDEDSSDSTSSTIRLVEVEFWVLRGDSNGELDKILTELSSKLLSSLISMNALSIGDHGGFTDRIINVLQWSDGPIHLPLILGVISLTVAVIRRSS